MKLLSIYNFHQIKLMQQIYLTKFLDLAPAKYHDKIINLCQLT